MKKLFAIALAAVLAISTMTATATLATSTETPIDPFVDVYASTDYTGSIIWMSDNKVIEGYGNGFFGPDNCVTRSELLKMIFEMKEIDETLSTAELFSDTPEGQWYTPYVRTARQRNTVQGYEDGTFRPGVCVNRAEAIKIAMLEFTDLDQAGDIIYKTYIDVPTDAWYKAYFNQAINTNTVGTEHAIYDYTDYAIYGYADYENVGYKFFPGDSMSRKEVAEMLFRLKAIADLAADRYAATILPNEIVELPITTNRLTIEDIFPQDVFATFELDLSSTAEIANFNNLVTKFPHETGAAFELEDSMTTFLDLIGDSEYQADFENAFQDNTDRFVFGLDVNESPLLAIEVKDNSKINRLIETITSGASPLYYEQNVLGFSTITSTEGYINMALAGNVVLISSDGQAQYMTLRNVANDGLTLTDNSIYNTYQAGEISPKFASLFINLESIFEANPYTTTSVPTIYDDINSENLSFSADRDGITMLAQVDINLGIEYKAPYMYREIPSENLIIYMEAYGLDDIFEIEMSALESTSYEFREIMDEFEYATEMNLQDDIFGAMNAGYAIVWQENTSLMPGVSVYADVSENKTEAQAMIDEMHTGVTAMVDEMIATAPDGVDGAKVFKLDTAKIGGQNVNRLTIDINAMPAEELEDADLPMGFFNEPIEFFYGITGDNYLVISTYADLESEYGTTSTVSRDTGFIAAQNKVADYDFGISYISVEMILDYVDDIVAEMEIAGGPMSQYEREQYEMIMSYIRPIKYIVSASGAVNSAEIMKGMLFIGIE